MDHRDVASVERNWYISIDRRRMRAIIELPRSDEEGDFDEEVDVPFIYEVCETCHGRGTHVNPSIDSHGISQDEWSEWDDEEREGYFSGHYDVECYECCGEKVIPVPDYEHIDDKLAEEIREYIIDIHQSAVDYTRALEMGY